MKSNLIITMLCIFAFVSKNNAQHTIFDCNDPSRSCSPYFLVKSEHPDRTVMALQSTSVEATIDGVIADISVRQTYVNTGSETIEAVYVFPGSVRAAVYGMEMMIGSRIIVAKVKERDAARKAYEQAKREGKTAGLLEQHRPNVFQMNVANILPGDIIQVTMSYTELIEHRNGMYELVYPGAVGPRYTAGNEEWVSRSVAQWMFSPPDFNISVDIKAGMPVQTVQCTSHQVRTDYYADQNGVNVALANPNDRTGNRDFILQYGLRGKQMQQGMLCYNHGDEQFFLLMMQPPEKPEIEQIPPREYIFIVDVSGSMHGFPIEVSKELLRKLISGLRPADIFNVMLFESDKVMLANTSLPATAANIQKALHLLDQQQGWGGTEMYSALQSAFGFKTSPDFARTFVIVTDGYVTVEGKAFQLVRDLRGKANLFAMGIGSDPNRHLIEGLAYAGAGEPYFITSHTEAIEVGAKLIEDISMPVLSHINIDWGGFDVYDVEPVAVPDLFAARPVVIHGKYRGAPQGVVTLSGKTGSGDFKQTFNVSQATMTQSQALRYLWARNRIRYLGDYASYFSDDIHYVYHTAPDAEREQITQLGLDYNLLTKYTSFLAVDNQARDFDSSMLPPQASTGNFLSIADDDAELGIFDTEMFFEKEEVYDEPEILIVETMPEFPGGDEALKQWLAANMKYPPKAQENGIYGRVYVTFVIDTQGNVTDVKVVRGIDPLLDAEAIRMIKSMPKWKPGMQRGRAVRVSYTVPINFELTEK